MTHVSVAVRLWAKTVALNAVFWGVGGIYIGEYWRVISALFFMIAGFLVTLPLLMLIAPLVRLSTWFPYSIPAKIGWLTFSLAVVIIVFYSVASLIIEQRLFSHHSPVNTMMGTTLAGLLVAVLTTRKSLVKLHTDTTNKNSAHSSL
jgi:hypothetical protein